MSSRNNPELTSTNEEESRLTWNAVEIIDPDALVAELLEFWSRQTEADIYARFGCFSSSARLIELYHHAFKYTRFAYALRHRGTLVGFSLGTISSTNPDWVEISMEVDRKFRNHGLGGSVVERLYFDSITNGYSGIIAEVLINNLPSRRVIDKFCQTNPYRLGSAHGIVTYHIGDIANIPDGLDLI